MIGNALRHVRSGEPMRIPAVAYNEFIDAAQWVRDRKFGNSVDTSRDLLGYKFLKCRNEGADLERWGVMQCLTPVFTDPTTAGFRNDLVMKLSAPTGPLRPLIAVAQEPIAAGSIGYCAVTGVTLAKIEVISPMGLADYAMPHGGQFKLRLADRGFPVLWKESTSAGDMYAAVLLDWQNFPIIGKLTATLARSGTSAGMAVHRPTGSGGIGAATGETLALVEDIGQIAAAASPLPVNTVVTVGQSNGSYILISYDCDAE